MLLLGAKRSGLVGYSGARRIICLNINLFGIDHGCFSPVTVRGVSTLTDTSHCRSKCVSFNSYDECGTRFTSTSGPLCHLIYHHVSSFQNLHPLTFFRATREFCELSEKKQLEFVTNNSDGDDLITKKVEKELKKPLDFTKVDINLLPTVVIVGRPNVGKSALFNRLIRRREALVYNTPDDHVTRDIREGVAKLGDLRFKVLDSAGLEAAASLGSILERTAGMTAHVLARSQLAIFLIDARSGLHFLDLEVGKWLRRNAPGMKLVVALNKAESLFDGGDTLISAALEAQRLGFGDPVPISAETGLGMQELYWAIRPVLEDYMQVLNDKEDMNGCSTQESSSHEDEISKLSLQLAIVGRPNVGKSTLLNMLLQEDRVLVGPEAGLTRDSVRAQFKFDGRTINLVDTAGWLQRSKEEKGPASLSVVQSRKSLMRAHIVALVLDAEEIAKERRTMKHSEVAIARRAVEEGRGLIVVVNKMDLLRKKHNSRSPENLMEAVSQEIQTVIPQVTGISVLYISALEGKGRMAVMGLIVQMFEKWCLRLPTARLNRWLHKVMSRHSWKDQSAQPKVKYFTQVKARPPTFVAFMSGKTQLSDTDMRFLTKSLKEDFDLGGIPIRIMQRAVQKKSIDGRGGGGKSSKSDGGRATTNRRILSDKRRVTAREPTIVS